MQIRSPVNPQMIMPVIGISIRLCIDGCIIRHHHPTFCAGNHFYKIKRESTSIPYGAQCLSFVGSANTLASIFQQKYPVFTGNCQ